MQVADESPGFLQTLYKLPKESPTIMLYAESIDSMLEPVNMAIKFRGGGKVGVVDSNPDGKSAGLSEKDTTSDEMLLVAGSNL